MSIITEYHLYVGFIIGIVALLIDNAYVRSWGHSMFTKWTCALFIASVCLFVYACNLWFPYV